jgi:hypothetical protein
MAVSNTLAYYGTETIIVIKSFIAQALEDLFFHLTSKVQT